VGGSKRFFSLPAAITWVASLSGLVLSVEALLKICTDCSETTDYRVFGLDFGWFGIGFFSLLLLMLALRGKATICHWGIRLMLFAAAGAEVRFIWIQKYEIGQWCPVCLSLAAAVFAACVGTGWENYREWAAKGTSMKSGLVCSLLAALFFVMGVGAAVVGVSKEAASAKPDLFLGRRSSPTTVYFVSDWFCPASRRVEPVIERMYPELARSVRIGFVDFPIHRETTSFTPFNLQFLAFEKTKYMSLRKALSALSLRTVTPTEDEVRRAIALLGVTLRPINYSDTLSGMEKNLAVYRGYGVSSTPTVVVTNAGTRKKLLLVGENRITPEAVRGAIAEVGKK
jgi:protein-disulfide isomerase